MPAIASESTARRVLGSSGPTGTTSAPGKGAAPSRCAATRTIGSTRGGAPRTRARRARPNRPTAGRPRRSASGLCSAASVSRPSVATPTANLSAPPGGPRASAAESATAWASGRASRWWSSGVSTSMSAEYGSSASDSTPRSRAPARLRPSRRVRAGGSSCRFRGRRRAKAPRRRRCERKRAPQRASRTPPRGRSACSRSLGFPGATGAAALLVSRRRVLAGWLGCLGARPARARHLDEGTRNENTHPHHPRRPRVGSRSRRRRRLGDEPSASGPIHGC